MAEIHPRIAVVVFPGSNDDRDAAWALKALGADPVLVWHAEEDFDRIDAVVLPGGFSYGDYLRCGAIARFAPAMEAVERFAGEGGPVLGICNGFQVLCEAGLLPGVLRPNASLAFVCRDVDAVVERTDTPFTSRCSLGQTLTIPVKHGEGATTRRRTFPRSRSSSVTRPARTRTARWTTSRGSSTATATSWASCPTRSTPSIPCSARATAHSCSHRSSMPHAPIISR